MRICAFDVYVQKKKKKKAKAMWSLRHTWLERAVPSPPFIKLFFPFILCINKYIFLFFSFSPALWREWQHDDTSAHLERRNAPFPNTQKKKRMKKKSITASKRKELVRNGKDWFFFCVCNVWIREKKKRFLRYFKEFSKTAHTSLKKKNQMSNSL